MAKTSPFRWPHRCFPEIRIVARAPFSPDRVAPAYCHPTYALHQHFYHGRLTIGRKSLSLEPGDVTISPPHVRSTYALKEAGYHWCVHFLPAGLPSGSSALTLPLFLPLHGAGGAVSERMREIFEIYTSSVGAARENTLAASTVSTKVQELLLHLALTHSRRRPSRPHHRRSDAALDDIKRLIDEEFHRRSFEVADLARACQLSRNYFSARFHERFGQTVDGYLLRRRIELAKTLLISTALPMKEIAFECGIPDPNYFNKQFRHLLGVSPTAYREQHR